MKMEEKVFSYIEKYRMIETGSQVIVGISGGADSVCLLFLLRKYQEKKEFSLYAVHVNHGIRGEEALRDEKFSENFCKRLEVPFAAYSYPVPEIARKEKISVEEAGRNVRRQAFAKKAEEICKDSVRIALAHHENDNAETVLHNLIRGTGAAGLGGIRPVQQGAGGNLLIRPLLSVQRQEIEEYLKEQQISWITDSTNQELCYTRNRIRHKILPQMECMNAQAVSHISQTAANLQQIEEYLQEQADMLYKKYVHKKEAYVIEKELFQEKEIMQTYVVMNVLEQAAGKRKDITSAHMEAVLRLAKGRTGASVSLTRGLTASQVYGDVHIRQKTEESILPLYEMEFRVFSFENQQIPEKTYTKWFDYDKIKSSLEIRRRMPGDYLTVHADGGRKKLKDYLIDCKIPRQERDSITLLADGSHIVWVVGYRISEYYKVTDQTKQVLEVQVKGVKNNE